MTVGSPLTHARVLLAKNSDAFKLAQDTRILPTCPPVTEIERGSGHRRITYDRGYHSADGALRTFTMFHHAAPFAVTRWTNLYFTQALLGLKGDPIGADRLDIRPVGQGRGHVHA